MNYTEPVIQVFEFYYSNSVLAGSQPGEGLVPTNPDNDVKW